MNERMKARARGVIKRIGWGLLIGGAVACANIAGPNGGPYDEKPPRFVSSTPPPLQTNYKGRHVEIVFDELIQVERPSQNVIIAPPQKELPSIQVIGRKIRVELKDTLRPNTTYTIDFGNSIADNNEKNPIGHFSFAFSTGDVIDSLEVGGVLLNAENLEPMPDIVVGLHATTGASPSATSPPAPTASTPWPMPTATTASTNPAKPSPSSTPPSHPPSASPPGKTPRGRTPSPSTPFAPSTIRTSYLTTSSCGSSRRPLSANTCSAPAATAPTSSRSASTPH